MSKSIIIIPSRLAASRLPQKPLIKINNKTLIMHVYEKAIQSQIGEVYVATCDEEIALEVGKNGGKFIMTDIKHTTGTDRVFEASQKLDLRDIDFIMNIQGDEPMINPIDIKNLNQLSKEKNLNISTLAHNIEKKEDFNNENIVKVVTKNKISDNSTTEALNFHRVVKEDSINNIYQHFGVYLYKYSALKKFVTFEKSKNEINERLEQLRAIDNNMKINVILAKYFSSGIDTKKDLEDYIKSFKK
tara:strand:+ start:12274 stop:13008 length:735 start_codon:yes stop_codon:yes gene_type:complete